MVTKALLLSLRPRFAKAILEGSKTVDVRRRPMKAKPGSTVLLYAAAPVMAIVGTAHVERTSVASADEVWARHGGTVGLERSELDDYSGGRHAHLLHLVGVRSLHPPLTIRGTGESPAFKPPRSFRYLHEGDPLEVHALAASSTTSRDRGDV